MSDTYTGSNNALVTDLQTQSQTSGIVDLFEVHLPNSDIGGAGVDKLYFHPGVDASSNEIEWLSLKDQNNYGSTTPNHYETVTYTALPIEVEGYEKKAQGTLPRPTIRMANINYFWNTYLTDYDDLIGAKVIRRRTLEKYLDSSYTVPIEFNQEVYFVERKISETPMAVEFELVSAFDLQGLKLPKRTVIAARCPWKYKDTDTGGCDWPADNKYTVDGVEYTLYFDKDDTQITLASNLDSIGANTYSYWGRQDSQTVQEASIYGAKTYAVGNNVQYQRPIGSLHTVASVSEGSKTITFTITTTSFDTSVFKIGNYIICKNMSGYDYKNVPLYISAVNAGAKTVTCRADDSGSGSYTTDSGYLQGCRPTLYKCITAHTLSTSDTADDIVKPTNISFWQFGDVCGKRLESCKIRYGYENNVQGQIRSVQLLVGTGIASGGSGYTGATSVAITGGGGSNGAATAVISGGVITGFTVTNRGSGYTSMPTVTITDSGGGSGALAVSSIVGLVTDYLTKNVDLPFGGFPGAALY